MAGMIHFFFMISPFCMVSAQAVKWLHRFYGVKAPNLSLRGGQRPTWRPEREARGECPWCNLRKAVTFSPGLSCYPTGYCGDCHGPWGLAMTRQESARCTSALLRLNHPGARRSESAATGFWVPAILMAARSKRRCGPAKDESYIFSKNGLFSQSLHNQIAPLGRSTYMPTMSSSPATQYA